MQPQYTALKERVNQLEREKSDLQVRLQRPEPLVRVLGTGSDLGYPPAAIQNPFGRLLRMGWRCPPRTLAAHGSTFPSNIGTSRFQAMKRLMAMPHLRLLLLVHAAGEQ